MAENYKHLYEQMKKMVEMYQDEIVPGLRKQIEELEKNQVKVRCKECKGWCSEEIAKQYGVDRYCTMTMMPTDADDFCSFGERREG